MTSIEIYAFLSHLFSSDGDEIFADTDSNETIQLPPLSAQSHHAAIDYSMTAPDLLEEVQ